VRESFLVDTDWIIDHLNGVAAVTERLIELRSAGLDAELSSPHAGP
jgi:hypothetical protein